MPKGDHNQKITDEEFIRLFPEIGAQGISTRFGVAITNIYKRRRRIEKNMGIELTSPNKMAMREPATNVRAKASVKDGAVVVFSDAHYWGDVSTAHLALVELVQELQPKILIANGDMLDGASISRHPPVNWEGVPDVREEIGYVQERLEELVDACPTAKRYWPLGNHDLRFNSRLATVAPEYKDIAGMHLKDHFPSWIPCMSLWLNDEVVVKHRVYSGIQARYNNTLKSGKSTVTGHTHQMGVTPWTDYNGTRFGVECGTLAEPYGPQFEYAEDNPKNHESGFAVLSFHKGDLMHPEFCRVVGQGVYEFRGERRKVKI